MTAVNPSLLIKCGTLPPDSEDWRKAYTYSTIGHGALILLMFLIAMGQRPHFRPVIREINFVEKTVPKPKAVESKRAESPVKSSALPVTKVEKKSKRGASRKKARAAKLASPRGKPEGKVVSPKPLPGPIIPTAQLGAIGKKRAAILELSGRSRARAPKDLIVPADANGGDELIALDTENISDIRRRESSVGTPLVSQRVVNGSLNGRAKHLASALPGRKKKATAEYLKANPLDKDKWGKQKGPFSMEGPLKYRKILKMELPPYPRWAEEKAVEAAVSIRLWVNPKGRVKDNMYLERTSGYSELDHLAMEALRRFIFVPLPDDQRQEDEWGVATFRYELRK